MRTRDVTVVAVLAGVLLGGSGETAAGQSDVAFPPEVYADRRARLFEALGRVPVIVPGADLTRRDEASRQDPNFWYLSGVESPYAILVMVPSGQGRRDVLFIPDRWQFAGAQYPLEDTRYRNAPWNRPIRRLSPATAASVAGMSESHPIDEFARRLPGLVGAAERAYLLREGGRPFVPPGLGEARTVRQQLEQSIAGLLPGVRFEDAGPAVERMRLIKDRYEIAALRRAAEISTLGLTEAMRAIRPGLNDREVAGLMEYVWKREGSPRPAFGPIVSSGPASISLYTLKSENYNSTDHVMRDGELVFIDYGAAEYLTYGSDLCRTYPVNGRFTDRQRFLYSVVLEAQDSALARIRPGVMMVEVIRAAARVYQRYGFDEFEDIGRMGEDLVWGVMPSPTHYLTQGKGITSSYSGASGTGVRDLGHHIGLEATDGRDYSGPLQPGMVFTVEPKLYVPGENVAIMIEDMILVTERGYENLSGAAPRRIDEIERIMGEARAARQQGRAP